MNTSSNLIKKNGCHLLVFPDDSDNNVDSWEIFPASVFLNKDSKMVLEAVKVPPSDIPTLLKTIKTSFEEQQKVFGKIRDKYLR